MRLDLSQPIIWQARASVKAFQIAAFKDALQLWATMDARIKFKRGDEWRVELSVGTDLIPMPLSSYSAYTQWVGVDGTIRRALIQHNAAYFQLQREPLARILTHELGHAFGLEHTDDRNDIMFPSYQGPFALSAADKAQFQRIYG